MGLDIWFQEDVQRALRAAMTSVSEMRRAGESMDPRMETWVEGYKAAIKTLAAAFGIPEEAVLDRLSSLSNVSPVVIVQPGSERIWLLGGPDSDVR